MAVRTDSAAHFPIAHPVRWLLWPAIGWAVVATVARAVRQRAQEPSMPRMSDEWLREIESSSGRAWDR